jgi:hypothetical protein
LVLDLAGDGIDLSGSVTTLLVSGEPQTVPWTVAQSDDAFLAVNATAARTAGWEILDSHGQLLDGVQLLAKGRRVRLPGQPEQIAGSALAMLGFLDANRDGIVDLRDPLGGLLLAVRDLDADGALGVADRASALSGSIDLVSGTFETGGFSGRYVEPGCSP